ncbi:Alpha/Beta hydrolase fold protein [Raphanus sativus]|nr:Alpha/Beta hydrolase fold protein [Raphanus sativus]
MEKNALWLLCFLVLPALACGKKEDDLVTSLPGQPPANFRHYAGYVNLGPQQKQKSLFYWFFEAQQNPSRRPLSPLAQRRSVSLSLYIRTYVYRHTYRKFQCSYHHWVKSSIVTHFDK